MADPSGRELKAGRKRRRPLTALGAASAVAVAFHPLLGCGSTAMIAMSGAASASQHDSIPRRSAAVPSSDPGNSSPASSLSSLSLAALASPWVDNAPSREGFLDESNDGSQELPARKASLYLEDDDDAAKTEGTREEDLAALSEPNEGMQVGQSSSSSSSAEPSPFQLGDFEKEVRMRFSDYQAELQDAMRSVRDRLDAARRQFGQSDLVTDRRAEAGSMIGGRQGEDESSRRDMSTKPYRVEVAVSADKISPRRLSRAERQLSKKRERLLRALSSFDEPKQDYARSKCDDEPWGELVSRHRAPRTRVSAQAAAAAAREAPQAHRDDRNESTKRKRVRVSASGHLHRVHRDLKGGGEGSSTTSSSAYYIPQIAQVASRRLFDAALHVADRRKTLRAHLQLLGTALLYVAVASIAIRMLMWALFIRRR